MDKCIMYGSQRYYAKKPHTEDTYYMIQFISNSRKGKTDQQLAEARNWGEGKYCERVYAVMETFHITSTNICQNASKYTQSW